MTILNKQNKVKIKFNIDLIIRDNYKLRHSKCLKIINNDITFEFKILDYKNNNFLIYDILDKKTYKCKFKKFKFDDDQIEGWINKSKDVKWSYIFSHIFDYKDDLYYLNVIMYVSNKTNKYKKIYLILSIDIFNSNFENKNYIEKNYN